MKVLIVDDEKNVRDAIKLLIPWRDYEVASILEAHDVESALACIESERPQIIFLDMMLYNQTGVEVLKRAGEIAPDSKIIVVSGYNDFEFVRNTVRYGGMDYLLKPIDREQLLEAFVKAVKDWREEETSRSSKQSDRMRINRIQPLYWDKTISDFLVEPNRNAAEMADIHEKLRTGQGTVQIALLTLRLIHASIYERFASHLDLLYFSILNICNEILNRTGSGYAFRNWNQEFEIGILLWDGHHETRKRIEEINEAIRTVLGSQMFFAIGNVHRFPQGASESYGEARSILMNQINLKQANAWIHDEPGPQAGDRKAVYFNAYEEKLAYAINSGQLNIVEATARSMIDEMNRLPEITLHHVQIWFYELQMFISKHFKELQGALSLHFKRLSHLNVEASGRVQVDQWLQEWEKTFILIGRTVKRSKSDKDSVTLQIVEYIQSHYHEELSLQQIADQFYLSREYISRKFKSDFGENLFDYLMRVRMEKACQFLQQSEMTIQGIARMVGIDNEKYFSKVFKKHTGHSPSQYRAALRAVGGIRERPEENV